jgi:hypothetical protein
MSLLVDSDEQPKNKRLGNDGYVRPIMTATDKLTKDDILGKLENYEKVDDISTVPTGTHIRYFSIVDGKQKFRLGGTLINKSNFPKYVVLTAQGKNWSVQINNTIFFKKISAETTKEEYTKLLEYKDKLIAEQGSRINELVKLVNSLKKEVKQMKNTKKII